MDAFPSAPDPWVYLEEKRLSVARVGKSQIQSAEATTGKYVKNKIKYSLRSEYCK